MISTIPTISEWMGRLGNNLQQISNAIYYCRDQRYNFHCPGNALIKPFSIEFGRDVELSHPFFYFDHFEGESLKKLNESRSDIFKEFIPG